jgi:hypothetical protein
LAQAILGLIDADHPVIGKLAGQLNGAVPHAAAGIENQRRLAVPAGEAGSKAALL